MYDDSSSFKELERTYKYILSPKMLRLMPVMIWTAISIAMVKGMFPQLLEDAMENTPEDLPKISQDEDL